MLVTNIEILKLLKLIEIPPALSYYMLPVTLVTKSSMPYILVMFSTISNIIGFIQIRSDSSITSHFLVTKSILA